MENNNYKSIPKEKFEFAQKDAKLSDKKLETKARGFFADAMIRFRKNQSSVIAAYVIGLLILFAIVSPIISRYSIKDKDNIYINYPPFVQAIADKHWGILEGSTVLASQNETAYARLQAIGLETGMSPIIEVLGTEEMESLYRGKPKISYFYKIKINRYYNIGIRSMNLSYEEFDAIQQFQNETGIQVIYPWVDAKDIKGIDNDPAIWYKVSDEKGTPKLDKEGNFQPAYSTNASAEGRPYFSQRIAGDEGNYIYSVAKSGSVQARICYYNYYIYMHGHEPMYLFGTNTMGQDLFCAIGIGARFSFIFAIVISAVNLTIGTIYGSIQGYYGGATDLIMDRIVEILSGIPFMVSVVLFQKYVADKVGVLGSLGFAFFLTGWIGMSGLVRKQFYRFKSQEYIMAARTLGASDKRLMFKHIFPNSLGTIITSVAMIIPGAISSETSLSYLGIIDLSGVVGTTFGTLMSQGQSVALTAPHAMVFPAIYYSLLLISCNLFGNGLRDAFNPQNRGLED